MLLKDKIAIVTGGGRGIGRSIAVRLAADHAVVVMCARTRSELSEVCKTIHQSGGRCEYAVVDVTQPEQIRAFIARVRALHGRIDVLINNAGFCAPIRVVEEVTEDEYRRTLATNLDSVFYVTRAVVPIMKEQSSGAIITVSSGCGRRGYPGLAVYSASNFAVQGFMQAVAVELEATPIRCVLVNPGAVATKMRADLFGEEEASRQQSPQGVANVVRDILKEEMVVPNGGGVCIRGGKVVEIYDLGK